MSDERVRAAERRWKATGSVDDEAQYLLERARAGELKESRLELAAYCGHDGAQRAVGHPAPAEDWLEGLRRFGGQARAQAIAAIAQIAASNIGSSHTELPMRLAALIDQAVESRTVESRSVLAQALRSEEAEALWEEAEFGWDKEVVDLDALYYCAAEIVGEGDWESGLNRFRFLAAQEEARVRQAVAGWALRPSKQSAADD